MKQRRMDLTQAEALVLQRARAGLQPTTSQRKETLARLASGLVLEPLPSTRFESSPAGRLQNQSGPRPGLTASAATSVGRFSLRAMVAGVLAGAVVGFGTGYLVAPNEAFPPLPGVDHMASVEHGQRAVDDEDGKGKTAPPGLAPTRQRAPHTSAKDSDGGSRHAGSPPRPPASTAARPTEAAEATFYEELSYVRRAQSALHDGDAILALGLMRSLDEIQPKGALLAERNVTRVLALCQLGRTEEATQIARRTLNGNPSADVYRRRLATSCAGASLSQASTASKKPVTDPVE